MKYLLILWVYTQPHMQQFDSLQDCERVKALIIEHGKHVFPNATYNDVDGPKCIRLGASNG